nr:capsid protein [Cressdnaviricota sp.]
MVYSRRSGYRGKRRYSNRVSKYPSGGIGKYVPLAMKAYRMAKMLVGLVNTESKFADLGVTTLNPSNTGGLTYLSGVAQGTTNITRVGNSLLAKSVLINIQCVINASATNTVVRLVLFVDHDNQGADPAVTTVLQSADSRAFINRLQGKRFSVLKDWQYVLNTSTNAQVNDKVYLKLHHHIKYGGTDATVASALQGNVFLLSISDQAVNTPTVIVNSRLRYIDN